MKLFDVCYFKQSVHFFNGCIIFFGIHEKNSRKRKLDFSFFIISKVMFKPQNHWNLKLSASDVKNRALIVEIWYRIYFAVVKIYPTKSTQSKTNTKSTKNLAHLVTWFKNKNRHIIKCVHTYYVHATNATNRCEYEQRCKMSNQFIIISSIITVWLLLSHTICNNSTYK